MFQKIVETNNLADLYIHTLEKAADTNKPFDLSN